MEDLTPAMVMGAMEEGMGMTMSTGLHLSMCVVEQQVCEAGWHVL